MTQILLTLENLTMYFGGIQALKSINMCIQKDSITSVIGPNGAGKTTLFNCITGFYKANEGSLVFHTPDKDLRIHEILGQPFKLEHLWRWDQAVKTLYYKMFGGSHHIARAGIARTFQNIRLFKEMSVIENLLVAQHLSMNRNILAGLIVSKSYQHQLNQALDNAYQWLERFHLAHLANRLAGELSYGQQRHLEIARCLCIQPSLLCLDEPAAGLNAHETGELCELVLTLKEELKLTVLLIEHDMTMVMKISDILFVLDHGEVISHGKPEQVAQDPKVIAAYLGIEEPNHPQPHGEYYEQKASHSI